jgi:hypothetical protein
MAVCLLGILGPIQPARAQNWTFKFPDLIVTQSQFYYQDGSQPDGGYKLSATVKNQGNGSSKSCLLRMRIYIPFIEGSLQVGEETKFVPALLPGQELEIANFHLYNYHYAGVKAQFMVDSTNLNLEVFEQNNYLWWYWTGF